MKLPDLFTEAIKDAETLMSLVDKKKPSPNDSALLRAALVFAMAAVDKILHEAISRHFATLAKDGTLDKFAQFKVSDAYEISLAAREGSGKRGDAKRRPGHSIKAEVLRQIYAKSYLATNRLQEVCAACGKKGIFTHRAKHRKELGKIPRSPKYLQDRWSRVYQHRNRIVHECDIKQQPKMRSAHFYPVDKGDLRRDINYVKNFGTYLAQELERKT
jgi:hypothetical protein